MEPINFLAFDTTTSDLKIALLIDNQKAFIDENNNFKHVEHLLPAIQSCFKKINKDIQDIQFIAVCVGPGSFTGIRIGIATTYGLLFRKDLKAFGFSVIDIYQYLLKDEKDSVVVPIIDAKKGRFYCSFLVNGNKSKIFDINITQIIRKLRKIVNINNNQRIIFVGKDFLLIKDQIAQHFSNYIEKYSNNYDSQDILKFVTWYIEKKQVFVYPKPIYLRKSEAELLLEKKRYN